MNEKGFFLLETIVLGTILIAAASVTYLFSAASRQQLHNEAAIAAAFLGQEQIARIEGKSKNELNTLGSVGWLGEGTNPVALNGYEFDVKTEIKPYEGTGIRYVAVTLSWTENGKKVSQTYRKLVDGRE